MLCLGASGLDFSFASYKFHQKADLPVDSNQRLKKLRKLTWPVDIRSFLGANRIKGLPFPASFLLANFSFRFDKAKFLHNLHDVKFKG